MPVLNKQSCPTCGQSVNERQIALFSAMIPALFRVYQWCLENNRTRFQYREIKHLFGTDNNIHTRFHDWVYFGNLLMKYVDDKGSTKGNYEINPARCQMFFEGALRINTKTYKNPLTKLYRDDDYRTIKDIPNLTSFLDKNWEYIVKYSNGGQSKLL